MNALSAAIRSIIADAGDDGIDAEDLLYQVREATGFLVEPAMADVALAEVYERSLEALVVAGLTECRYGVWRLAAQSNWLASMPMIPLAIGVPVISGVSGLSGIVASLVDSRDPACVTIALTDPNAGYHGVGGWHLRVDLGQPAGMGHALRYGHQQGSWKFRSALGRRLAIGRSSDARDGMLAARLSYRHLVGKTSDADRCAVAEVLAAMAEVLAAMAAS